MNMPSLKSFQGETPDRVATADVEARNALWEVNDMTAEIQNNEPEPQILDEPCPWLTTHSLVHRLIQQIMAADSNVKVVYPVDVSIRLASIIAERNRLRRQEKPMGKEAEMKVHVAVDTEAIREHIDKQMCSLAHQLITRIMAADSNADPQYAADVDLRLASIIAERDRLRVETQKCRCAATSGDKCEVHE